MADHIKEQRITVASMEQLEAKTGRFYELVEGELIEKPMASPKHAEIAVLLAIHLGGFILTNKLGKAYDSSCSYLLCGTPDAPELVYLPDFSFVAAERVQDIYRGFYQLVPDLAVEIISPTERPTKIKQKLKNYLAEGVKQVWHIYPEKKQIEVFMPDGSSQIFNEEDALSGGDILPGFSLEVRVLF